MKLCIDCAHYRYGIKGMSLSNPFLLCRRALSDRRSPVDGTLAHLLNEWPEKERKPGRAFLGRQRCGPEARYFEPIDPASIPS